MTDGEPLLYYNPRSRARVVHWLLEELGVPYRLELVRMDRKAHKEPAYLAVNPMGKVPALVHRGVTVTETAAILTYLADAYPAAGLAPATTDPARGTYLRWLFFGSGCMEPAIVDKLTGRPPVERTSAQGYGTYEDTLAALELAVTPGPYVLGEAFSAVDVYLGAQLGYGFMTRTIEPRPVFQAYVARTTDRPAFKRFMAQSAEYVAKLESQSG